MSIVVIPATVLLNGAYLVRLENSDWVSYPASKSRPRKVVMMGDTLANNIEYMTKPELRAELARLRAEVEQLRIDAEAGRRLPVTADGVRVYPGMKLYPKHPIPDVDNDHGIVTIGIYDPVTMEHRVHGYDEFRVGLNYSSKLEALRAAQEGGGA